MSATFSEDYKEYRKVKGIRPDYYNPKTKTIYELKPYNPRSAKAGVEIPASKKYLKMLKKLKMRVSFWPLTEETSEEKSRVPSTCFSHL